jgi:predicted nucleic acid-binding protein
VERLYLDTNVLFPMTLMDLMLSMAEDFHHDLLWSDFLLDEWERVIVREQRRTPEQASAITGAIRQVFPSGRIAPDNYESRCPPDPDDRVHGAAALAGGATALITANLRHFDAAFFIRRGVIVETPDSYLLRQLQAGPEAILDTLKRVVALKTRPRWTLNHYLGRLERAGAPQFALAIRSRTHSSGGPASPDPRRA